MATVLLKHLKPLCLGGKLCQVDRMEADTSIQEEERTQEGQKWLEGGSRKGGNGTFLHTRHRGGNWLESLYKGMRDCQKSPISLSLHAAAAQASWGCPCGPSLRNSGYLAR